MTTRANTASVRVDKDLLGIARRVSESTGRSVRHIIDTGLDKYLKELSNDDKYLGDRDDNPGPAGAPGAAPGTHVAAG